MHLKDGVTLSSLEKKFYFVNNLGLFTIQPIIYHFISYTIDTNFISTFCIEMEHILLKGMYT